MYFRVIIYSLVSYTNKTYLLLVCFFTKALCRLVFSLERLYRVIIKDFIKAFNEPKVCAQYFFLKVLFFGLVLRPKPDGRKIENHKAKKLTIKIN